jgi:hypothetical protein
MRAATVDDIPRLIDLVGRLVSRAGIPQSMDPERVREVLVGLLNRMDAVVWITDAGFLAASIERTVISPEPIAVEHGWYAEDGQGMALLTALELWADCHGARVRLSTGPDGPDLTRRGYRMVERAWVK